jgi:hypothetical protein
LWVKAEVLQPSTMAIMGRSVNDFTSHIQSLHGRFVFEHIPM